jgi:hypothetical protein
VSGGRAVGSGSSLGTETVDKSGAKKAAEPQLEGIAAGNSVTASKEGHVELPFLNEGIRGRGNGG